jgi:FtsP/CotA-like multicopper oxidase with cupredoxin domain
VNHFSSTRRAGALGALLALGAMALGACNSTTGTNAVGAETTAPVAATSSACSGHVRNYYIAADKVAWNYAPSGKNLVTGKAFGDQEKTYLQQGPDRIGPTSYKSLYRAYTDATFTHLAPRPAQWQHLGTLGPVIQAEVGDTVHVVFKNNTPFPASMHPHGLEYAKDSEGAPYDDGTSGAAKADDAVAPGAKHTYVWHAPARSGPGPNDPSSVMWMYMSHTDEIADTYAGLVGPIIVTKCGMARADGSPKDVDVQLVTMFEVDNENNSHWIDQNIAHFATDPGSVDKNDDDFIESNLKHSINGYVYGNTPGLVMHKGQRVRWYLMGMGTEVDLHTPHWHGNTVTNMGMRTDVVSLLPGTMITADMVPDDVGTWLFHCHVDDHISAGMIAKYKVLP